MFLSEFEGQTAEGIRPSVCRLHEFEPLGTLEPTYRHLQASLKKWLRWLAGAQVEFSPWTVQELRQTAVGSRGIHRRKNGSSRTSRLALG